MSMVNDAALNQSGDDDWFFPKVDAGLTPFGSRVLVQIRSVREKSNGGIILTQSSKDTEHDNTQVAIVVAVGPLAYKNRNTMEAWPEGAWCNPGDFVYVPRYGGSRFERKLSKPIESAKYGKVEKVQFAIFDDLNFLGKVDDPHSIPAYLGQ